MWCRAVLLDIDDTLYPERRFALSGYRAVAHDVERRTGTPARAVFGMLRAMLAAGERAGAFQRMCAHLGLDEAIVPELVYLLRTHPARLRLPRPAARLLDRLRPHHRLAIVTNGPVEMQRNKVRALGLASLVDEVVYAVEHGGIGKPEPAPFLEALRRLGVKPCETVHVGDDPVRDIAGARAVGLRTIRVRWITRARFSPSAEQEADAVVDSLEDVVTAIAKLNGGQHVL